MAASMLSRFVLQTTRLSAAAFRHQTFCGAPSRSFSVSSCIFKGKLYTEKHEWVEKRDAGKDTLYTVGISDYAQDSLGEIVYVQLPEVGEQYAKEDIVGCVESVKAASDIYCPVTGTVVEVNKALEQTPGLINKQPEDAGWMFKLDAGESAASELEELMDEAAYKKYSEDK